MRIVFATFGDVNPRALLAGKPMLVMPYSHDQPDNARHMERLGVARVLPRERYTAVRAAKELSAMLRDPGYAAREREIAARISSENGLTAACHARESAVL